MPEPKRTGLSDNSIAATAYFTPFMAVFFLAIRRYNKRPYVRYHAWQSLLFNVFVIASAYLLDYLSPYIKYLGFSTLGLRIVMIAVGAAGLAAFLIWLWCVIGALSGKRVKLPIIGEWADEQAYR